MSRPEPSCVVVLTTPDGQQRLSSASLMYPEEAEGEARSWRRTAYPPGGRWTADVRDIGQQPWEAA